MAISQQEVGRTLGEKRHRHVEKRPRHGWFTAARLDMHESVGELGALVKVGSSRTCCGFVRMFFSMRSWRLARQRAVTFAGAAILAKPPLRELLVRRLRVSISSGVTERSLLLPLVRY
ncbi:hypothetical protein [Ectopseudomonas toyotomiensis]|uniref:hypothetical protein n=1 Tax=Ectopseudomonas toyotomiensis TaxID=554344 RepID=UPI0018C408FD|nr:hypothetical protein [Pseudomonas toyotomiensis]MBG0840119.1 hypothetical protein [Pseudomonas toyotomiensis]